MGQMFGSALGFDMDHHINTTQMLWKPQLLRLTQVPHPKLDGEVPTACFIDPSMILMIRRTLVTFPEKPERFDVCTLVITGVGSSYLHVMESPEQVATMRDRALGFAPTLKEV